MIVPANHYLMPQSMNILRACMLTLKKKVLNVLFLKNKIENGLLSDRIQNENSRVFFSSSSGITSDSIITLLTARGEKVYSLCHFISWWCYQLSEENQRLLNLGLGREKSVSFGTY